MYTIADTMPIKSVSTICNPISCISKLSKLLGYRKTGYNVELHHLEDPFKLTTIVEVHLRRDCIDGSIVDGVSEIILFHFVCSSWSKN